MIIKICGLTRAEDARFAVQAGADWIGLNFVAGPRKVAMGDAERILEHVDAPACAVALIPVDDTDDYQRQADLLAGMGVQRLQLYGQVTPEVVARISARGMQPIVVRTAADGSALQAADRFLKECAEVPPAFVLLDAASAGRLGGTGKRANWPAIAEATRGDLFVDWPPVILAGGLDAENVTAAIHELSPRGVDVSSGVETTVGRKDRSKVAAFIEAARVAQ